MALTAYTRFRFLWGGVDWQSGSGNPYATAQTGDLGTSAVAGSGIGVRRLIIVVDRTLSHAGADPAEIHFDFLNMTGGNPDDTWISSDYTTLEGYVDTMFTTLKAFMHTGYRVTEYRWYREGVGVGKPNPAERVTTKGTPIVGTGANHTLPPQAANSITFRTAVRKSWGRTYLPLTTIVLSSTGNVSSGNVDTILGSVSTMISSAASSDFYLVVTSRTLSAALNVERLEMDDNVDVIRRRRWKQSTYKKLLP